MCSVICSSLGLVSGFGLWTETPPMNKCKFLYQLLLSKYLFLCLIKQNRWQTVTCHKKHPTIDPHNTFLHLLLWFLSFLKWEPNDWSMYLPEHLRASRQNQDTIESSRWYANPHPWQRPTRSCQPSPDQINTFLLVSSNGRSNQRTLTYFVRGNITVRLTSCLTG